MNKKIFLSAGALILAVAGILATRASVKFFPITNLYYKGVTCQLVASGCSLATVRFLTSGQPGTHQALINTSGSSGFAGLYATSTCIKPVYLAL